MARRYRPLFVRPRVRPLEDRVTPANFFVDPDFVAGPPLTFSTVPNGPGSAEAANAPLVVGDNAFETIADAVAAANGAAGADVIFLSDDTHEVNPFAGGIEVTDELRVEGQGIADTTVRVSDDTATGTGLTGAVFYTQGARFDVKGLTFDGRSGEVNPSTAGSFFVGSAFRFQGGTGSVTDVRVTNLNADTGTQNLGVGVVAFGPGADVDVTGSKFDDVGRTGVSFYDRATGSVQGSAFAGRAGVFSYGVEIQEGSTALVTGSTFTGYDFFDPNVASSAGVVVGDVLDQNFTGAGGFDEQPSAGTIIGNAFTANKSAAVIVGNGVGVDFGGQTRSDTSSATVQHNNFNSGAATSFSILANTTALVNALFNYYGSPNGPLAQNTNVTGTANPTGSVENEVDDQVVYQDPAIASVGPLGGVLTAPTPVLSAPSGEAYRALLPLVAATVTAPNGGAATNQQPTLGVMFTEAVAGVTAADFAATGPGAPAVGTPTGTGTTYAVPLTGLNGVGAATLQAPASGLEAVATKLVGTVNLPTIRSGLFAGVAASNTASVPFDNVVPTVQVTSPVVTASTTQNNPVSVTVVFNEAVTGIDKADFTVGGSATGTVQNVTASADNKTFTVQIGGLAGSGTITLAVAADAGVDAAGNKTPALAAATVANADLVGPVATVVVPGNAATAQKAADVQVTITFPEAVTGFDKTDVVVGGSTGAAVTSVTPSADNKTFTVTLSGATASGAVTVGVAADAATDAAGNKSGAAVAGVTVATFDTVAPTITVPGPVATVSSTQNNPLSVTVVFNEAVTGFDKADITLGGTAAGATVNSVTASADNKSFVVQIGGITGSGTVTLAVPAGAATDAAGNNTPALAAALVANADLTVPTVTVTSASLPNGSFQAVFTFTEPVVGFDKTDVVVGGTATGASVTSFTASADNKTFTAVIGGFTKNGSVTAALATGAAADAAGNPTAALAPTAVGVFQATAPTAAVSVLPGTQTGSFPVTITFDQAVTGFDKTDVTVGGTAGAGTVQGVTTTDNKTFTVTLGGFTQRGTVTVAVPAGAATNSSGTASAAVATTTAATFAPAFSRGFAIGGSSAATTPFITVDDVFAKGGGTVSGTVAATQGVRVATADVNGDGVLDIIVGSSPGQASNVKVYSGVDKTTVLFNVTPFESSFTGGVFVAAGDVNGDGRADIVITPDQSGGPRVDIYSSNGTAFSKVGSFFGIDDNNFRGGARAALGDLNADGKADLVVSAGFSGGPRIAGFDGTTLTTATPRKIFADFFAFEDTLRNGAYVAVGDLNADGKADLIFGGGPGGGPRVRALDGLALITNNTQTQIANFFAGTDSNRGGVRVAARDLDGDSKIDIVTGDGASGSREAKVYYGKNISGIQSGSPTPNQTVDAGAGFADGIYVG